MYRKEELTVQETFVGADMEQSNNKKIWTMQLRIAMIYSNDFCVSEFSHKKYLRFRID